MWLICMEVQRSRFGVNRVTWVLSTKLGAELVYHRHRVQLLFLYLALLPV